MKALTIHATTEITYSRFRIALLSVPIPLDHLTWNVERGLASVTLPDNHDAERLARALEERGLEVCKEEPFDMHGFANDLLGGIGRGTE